MQQANIDKHIEEIEKNYSKRENMLAHEKDESGLTNFERAIYKQQEKLDYG